MDVDELSLKGRIKGLYNQYLMETRSGSFENWLMKKGYL